MENNKKESLKDVIDRFINTKRDLLKKERENNFSEEIGEIHEFKDLSEVDEVHNLELELNKLEEANDNVEELIKEIADDIKLIDDMIKIPCKINTEDRLLINTVNCNIKPIPLLNVALITNLNVNIVEVELNDYMMSVMDVILLLTLRMEDGNLIAVKSDVNTLYKLGLITAVDSLLAEIELSPIEFRGITSLLTINEVEQLLKYLNRIE
jgi:hypothetical protein